MVDINWVREQVEAFEAARPRYEQYADVLRNVLDNATDRLAPSSIVQARAKRVASFAEKMLRKDKYRQPLREMTDLCGARIITHTQAEIQRICRFIRDHFEIDEANSLDAPERLRATEFGYRPVHYVVRFKRGVFPTAVVPVTIPEDVYELKAEIQVRTIAQHAWADIGHDRFSKNAFKLPRRHVRHSARAAAMLENADEAFGRVAKEIDEYRTSYATYMDRPQMERELQGLELVFEKDRHNPELARRIARLAISLEAWEKVIGFLEEDYQGAKTAPLLAALGFAYCQKHRQNRLAPGYKQGQWYLEQVAREHPDNWEAMTLLADSWFGVSDREALRWYGQAFRANPHDPGAVAGYLTLKIARDGTPALASMFSPSLQAAIAKCREQIEIGINLPAAWYHLGEFLVLTDSPYESLAAYCRGISLTSGPAALQAPLSRIEKLIDLRREVPSLEWISRLLHLAKAAKFPDGEPRQELQPLLSQPDWKIEPPVVIVAGGCDPAVEQEMQQYRDLLFAAFEGFQGTVISGGTTAGISGLVGELSGVYPDRICTIGYVTKYTPSHVTEDQRYTKLRRHEGTDFTALEPIQNWIDLVASGVRPWQVKVLGINGGTIAAFEYRLALAMGARVGVLEDSGREAGTVIREAEWENIQGLARPAPSLVNSSTRWPRPSTTPSGRSKRTASWAKSRPWPTGTSSKRTSDNRTFNRQATSIRSWPPWARKPFPPPTPMMSGSPSSPTRKWSGWPKWSTPDGTSSACSPDGRSAHATRP
jgi:ppGpp synthetase/RelA/SpoT-type nucleotidyltranferase